MFNPCAMSNEILPDFTLVDESNLDYAFASGEGLSYVVTEPLYWTEVGVIARVVTKRSIHVKPSSHQATLAYKTEQQWIGPDEYEIYKESPLTMHLISCLRLYEKYSHYLDEIMPKILKGNVV